MPRWFLSPVLPSLLSIWGFASAFGQTETFKPTWETRRHARTFTLDIPAPRGQISDRNGEVLAQTRLSYNLAVNFPTPLDFSDDAAIRFAREQISKAERVTNRTISISDETILRHYKNRGLLPLDLVQDIPANEQEAVKAQGSDGLILRPIYLRHYPNGTMAAHLIGYAGRAGRLPDGPIQNNELLWPEAEGRAGLEMTFNEQLTGKPGQMTYNFNSKGHKVSETVTVPPEPGYNVVTTLDLNLQRLCEKALGEGVKRGAIVFLDPNSGDVLAMASWPTFDPNLFIPAISTDDFKALNENKDKPLLPRAYASAYPPGSVFKMFVAMAALESGKITPTQEFSGPPSLQIGNTVMRNWKKTHSGMLTVVDALEESNDTWFYQVGIRTGTKPLVEWALRFGFGAKTGIPLRGETEGRIPDDEYMRKVHQRKLLDGDLANFSIGQGDILVSPLQVAQAIGILANGGTFYQTRLVQQVQSLDDQVVTGYDLRIKEEIAMTPENLEAVQKGMIEVVSGGRATGRRAGVDNVQVAGKTGTAQWGPKTNERYAAWFAGYAPADKPKYAFAVIYESDPNEHTAHGGSAAAPIIGKVLKEVFKEESKPSKRKKKGKKAEPTPEPTPSEFDEAD